MQAIRDKDASRASKELHMQEVTDVENGIGRICMVKITDVFMAGEDLSLGNVHVG